MKPTPVLLALVAIVCVAGPAWAYEVLWSQDLQGSGGTLLHVRAPAAATCEVDEFVLGQDFASLLAHWPGSEAAGAPARLTVNADYPLPMGADVATTRGVVSPWNVLPRVSPYDLLPQVNHETYLDTPLPAGESVLLFAHEQIRVWDTPETTFMFVCDDNTGVEVLGATPLALTYADHTQFPDGGLGVRVNALGDRLVVAQNRSLSLDLPHGGIVYFQGYGQVAPFGMTLRLQGPAGISEAALGTPSSPAKLYASSTGPAHVTATYDGIAAGGTVWMPLFALGYPAPQP